MFTMTHLNTCTQGVITHKVFILNCSILWVIHNSYIMWELELSLMNLEEMVQEKRKLFSKKIYEFLVKKETNSEDWAWKALYLVEFITYCGWNFIPVWDESIEPCSQYASSCPGEIKEIRDKINSKIRQTVGKKRREERIGLEKGYNCRY